MQQRPRFPLTATERRFRAALRLVARRETHPSVRGLGGLAGPLVFIAITLAPLPAGMGEDARTTAAVAVWMATWWVTRALPLHYTALLPLALFPMLGVRGLAESAPSYWSGVIFLFLGGFILAAAVERWGLHRRLAHAVTPRSPRPASWVLLSFMASSAFLSMWMSNTAAAMVMLPVAAEVVPRREDSPTATRVGTAFMLGLAYAASIGGIGTIIGSPPNAVFAGYAREVLGEPITFLRWMAWGVPMAVVGLGIVWFFLVQVAYREVRTYRIGWQDGHTVSPLGPEETRVLLVFGTVVLLWLSRGVVPALGASGITDEAVAMAGAVLMLLLPARGLRGPRLLQLRDLRTLPWGILVLFGGGISLAGAIESSGLAIWIGQQVAAIHELPPILLLLAIVGVTILLTELASNTATAAILIPIAHGAAAVLGLVPLEVAVAVATAASCAFMLPVATPPNAVVFASGRVSLGAMLRAGIALNVLLAGAVTGMAVQWLPIAWP